MANDTFQFALAKTYLAGEDEDKGLEGLEMMKKLAEGGNGEAAFIVGVEYSENYLVLHDVDEAIAHVNAYGSHHSDCIVTNDAARAAKFLRDVDSAAVYHNVSTRFTDGAEFGMGAEIGISTDKLHARGPMGLEELTTYKYVVTGDGVVRS